ncbi:uridine-cytidine kinase-like protein 2 [Chytriomyces sp. MP71]|nr:uridine-cytidine kinase-like protein 2 [Chytriomyces sp. MP71]
MVFFVAITGGPSSGKKEVCSVIIDELKNGLVDHSQKVAVIKMETFYKTLTEAEEALLGADKYNFDHPTAIDFDMLSQTLDSLERGETVVLAKYDFSTHKRLEDTFEVVSPDVVILVGTLALYDARVRSHFNLKVFVDVDSDLRLARQVVRDTEQRYTKPLEAVLDQYLNYVKPSFEDFILPTKKYADVVIPRGINNKVAIKLMATHLVDILKENKGGQAPLSVEQIEQAQLTV